MLASAEASDASSEGRQVETSLPLAASTGGEAEADSCGYEGDVGESTKLTSSVRRLANVVVIPPRGVSAKASTLYIHYGCPRVRY